MTNKLYTPLKLFIFYIAITLIISLFGPVEYYGYHKWYVVVFMTSFILLFSAGYSLGVQRSNHRSGKQRFAFSESNVLTFLKMSINVTLLLSVWGLLDYIFKYGFTIKNLGQAYIDIYAGYERNAGRSYSLLELAQMFTGIFKYSAMILGVYYWKKLERKWRHRLLIAVSVSIFSTLILTGKMKFIGDFVIVYLSVFLVRVKMSKLMIKKRYIFSVLAAGLFMFVIIQKLRYDAIGINLSNYNFAVTYHVYMNPKHLLFQIFGETWGFPIAILLTSYISGGYYGLSLCLSLPFQWTYGLGHSYSLAVIMNRFLGLPFLFNDNYTMRMEEVYGWPAMQKWHTIFPYFASDLTFLGTLVFFFIIAVIYATAYVESVKYQNPVSLMLYTFLNIMLIFVPANNQLMIGPESYFAFVILLLYWGFNHLKYNCLKEGV